MKPVFAARLSTVSLALAIAACSSPSVEEALQAPGDTANAPPAWSADSAYSDDAAQPGANRTTAAPPRPRIVATTSRLQCVAYARRQSGISIHGDAWTWWRQARGKYDRSRRPTVGSVLVVGRTSRNSYGHLAVVTRIVSDREIIVNHANWLNKGQIHLDTPVRDVSPGNDWSAVRFWYTPGHVLGRRIYPVSGFVQPSPAVASRS